MDKQRTEGWIYIFTNPSFKNYVKIGYADDVEKRLDQLSRSECTPFAFRVFAKYKVFTRLTDLKVHDMIDKLNPTLRSRDRIKGKDRVREFFEMSPEDAYLIFQAMAEIHGTMDNLVLVEPTLEDINNEEESEEVQTKIKRENLPRMDWLIKNGALNIGDQIYVISHPDDLATIVDGEHVDYKGKFLSLNQFACKITGWKSIQSYIYTKRVGDDRTLSEIRREKMDELHYQ